MKSVSVRYVGGRLVYSEHGRVLSDDEVRRRFPPREGCPRIKLSPDSGWESENDGRGRYISQLAEHHDDRAAYCRSQSEAIEKAKRKGWTATRCDRV